MLLPIPKDPQEVLLVGLKKIVVVRIFRRVRGDKQVGNCFLLPLLLLLQLHEVLVPYRLNPA